MGATGSAGPIILQAGLSARHVMESYTTTGPNVAYSQNKAQPGSYTVNTVYGPSGADSSTYQDAYVPKITINASRGYATGPSDLYQDDLAGIITFNNNNTELASIRSTKFGPTGSTHGLLTFSTGGNGVLTLTSIKLGDDAPDGAAALLGATLYPSSSEAYDIGTTVYQFKDVHFSGSLFNNGVPFQGGVSGLTYRATGPTGPTGGPTGPYPNPTLQVGAFLVPTTNATYDLGATGIQFKDVHFSGSLYNNGVPFSGAASYSTGSYTDPVTNVTVTGPILSMGATGSAGPIILQAGLSATHVLERYTATGPNLAYSQTKTQPGSYTINNIYGPSGAGTTANLLYVPQVSFNASRGYATGPTSLQNGDIMGAVTFKENTDLRGFIYATKVGNGDHASMTFNVGSGYGILSINTTGPDDSIQNHNIKINGQVYPESTNFVNLGATGYQFNNIHFGGTLYQNGQPFQQTGLTYRATGPTGPTGGATGPNAPTLQVGAFLVPTVDATYDLGATGIQFKDVHFSGSLYNNGVPFSGGGAATYPTGSYRDPLTNLTVTGPILTMGATGSAGPIILQAGLSPNHVLESYTTTGPNWSYSQVKAKPGSYNLNTVYGPSGPDFQNNLFTYVPQITFNTSRGYATGPTGLNQYDIMGAIFFKDNDTLRTGIAAYEGNDVITLFALNDAGPVVLASATPTGNLSLPASSFRPVGPATTENCIQPQTGTPYANTFLLMATSANGQYITIPGPPVVSSSYNNTLIMVSSDSGVTFTPKLMTGARTTASPTAVAVSESGTYQIVVDTLPGAEDYAGGIFVSSNFGSTWDEAYLDGAGTAKFLGCAVSQTSPSSNPIFVAAANIKTGGTNAPGFIYCRGVPTQKTSWTEVTVYNTSTAFASVTSVTISDDGTRLAVLDTVGATKVVAFYEITAGAVTYKSHINIGTIGSRTSLENQIISNFNEGGLSLVAANAVGIYNYNVSWPTAADTPAINNTTGYPIIGDLNTPTLPTKIVTSSDRTFQLAQNTDQDTTQTYTYISSNSGVTWTDIDQNQQSPFNKLTTIAMSADASITYALAREADNSFKQALRKSVRVKVYTQSGPTTALTYDTVGAASLINSHFIPASNDTYDLGATATKFKDIYFNGNLYKSDDTPFLEGITGLTYRATGPTGPTGGSTGPTGPTIQIDSFLVPTTNATYDLGATGIQFKDVHFSGSLYNNGTPFSGGGGGITGLTYRATGPTGPTGGATGPAPYPTIQIDTHLVPTTDLTYDLGATGLRFRDMYVGGSTIYMGDSVRLSAAGTTFSVNSAPLVSSTTVPNTGAGGFGVTFETKGALQTLGQTLPGTIAMSADGKYISYITGSSESLGDIYVSSNFGTSFVISPSYSTNTASDATEGVPMTSLRYVAIAVSSTGQYQTALEHNGGVFVSQDFGVSWRETFAYTFGDPGSTGTESWYIPVESTLYPWAGVSVSTDGLIQFLWVSNTVDGFLSNKMVPQVLGDWLESNFSASTYDFAMSSNGDRCLQFDGIYINAFTIVRNTPPVRQASGSTIVVSSLGFADENLCILQLSGDGARFAIYGSKLTSLNEPAPASQQYTWSINGGGTITPVDTLSFITENKNIPVSVNAAISYDGSLQLVAFGNGNNVTGMYISYNSGATWSAVSTLSSIVIQFILVSGDKFYVNAFTTGGTIFYQCLATTPTVTITGIPYTPTTAGDWPSALVPITVAGALDTIAKYLKTYETANWSGLT
jgi:hypothetical protein